MLRNIKLVIAYDGSMYHGWQKQDNEISIQEEIERAIFESLGQKTEITGSGRTDAGVHALAQVANFIIDSSIPASNIKFALNNKLNNDIRIISSEEVDMSFNARFSAKKKTYMYQIYNNKINYPFYDKYAWHIPFDLDIEKMRKMLKIIEGEHDFRAFMSAKATVNSTTRTIYDTSIYKNHENLIKIEICGNGFLYNMVRIIVGTAVTVGGGRKEESLVYEALQNGERSLLGMTAVPRGLFLKNVEY